MKSSGRYRGQNLAKYKAHPRNEDLGCAAGEVTPRTHLDDPASNACKLIDVQGRYGGLTVSSRCLAFTESEVHTCKYKPDSFGPRGSKYLFAFSSILPFRFPPSALVITNVATTVSTSTVEPMPRLLYEYRIPKHSVVRRHLLRFTSAIMTT